MTELEMEAEGFKFHLNLGFLFFVFSFFCLSVCFIFLFFFSPLMKQWTNYFWDTISRIGCWGTNTKIIKTETLLHLNLGIFFLILCLSNVCLVYHWLVHYLSLFISLALVFCYCFFNCLFVCLFFPFSLPSLLSLSSHPSILDITIVIITS
jgi:hypothetical protein